MCYSLDLRKKVISFIENGNIARYVKVVALRFMATPRKLWETNVGLRLATHIMSTFACLAIVVSQENTTL